MDVRYVAQAAARRAADQAAAGRERDQAVTVYDGYDGQDRAWRRSLRDHTRRRILDADKVPGRGAAALESPPF